MKVDDSGVRDERSSIAEMIVEKADGVFLWVELAVKSQISGIRNDDDLETLRKRLESLSPEVEGLYTNMIHRIDKTYQEEAAHYLSIAQNLGTWGRSSIFDFALALFGLDENMHLKHVALDFETIVSKCPRIEERVTLTCGGFLEIYQKDEQTKSDELRPHRPWLTWLPSSSHSKWADRNWRLVAVKFCHRTAREFFEADTAGREFMGFGHPMKQNCQFLNIAVCLAEMALCRLTDLTSLRIYMSKIINSMFEDMLSLQSYDSGFGADDPGLSEFLRYTDVAIASLDKHFNGPDNISHWCQRWGPLFE